MSKPSNADRLRDHARAVQLWTHAQGLRTGPRSLDGKRRSALRGLKHGLRTPGYYALRAYLRSLKSLLNDLEARKR